MSKKISIRGHSTQTYAEVFQSFISAKTAQGVADITIRNYHNNLHVISKYRLYSEEGWWTYTYLLCYEEIIIQIRFDWEPTANKWKSLVRN